MIFRARVHIIIILIASALSLPLTVTAQQPDNRLKWEQTDNSPSPEVSRQPDGANVRVQDMQIYVELDQPQTVKLFTILGQPISQVQLPAGTSRFRVSARGIYILKIGSSTRRVTI